MTIVKTTVSELIKRVCENDLLKTSLMENSYRNLKFFFKDDKITSILAGGLAKKIFFSATNLSTSPMKTDESLDSKIYNYFSHGGDIDVFFTSKEAAESAVLQVARQGIKYKKTSLNSETWFISRRYPEHLTVCCQYIKCCCGTPEEVLNQFDIVNAQVAVDIKTDSAWYNPEIVDLEKEEVMSLNTSLPKNNSHLVKRIALYTERGGVYTSFNKKNESLEYFIKCCRENLKIQEGNDGYLNILLDEEKLIPTDSLTLLIGLSSVYDEEENDYYALKQPPKQIDAAIEQIIKRNKKRTK